MRPRSAGSAGAPRAGTNHARLSWLGRMYRLAVSPTVDTVSTPGETHMQFKEFWSVYLHAHSRRSTRALHYVATVFFGFMAAVAVAVEQIWIVPAGIAGSYAIAVMAHWGFERNQPLFVVNPLWGAVADLRMCWLALTGRLRRALVKCRVPGYGPGYPGAANE